MFEFFIKYQKIISLGVGALMLFGAVGILFWNNQNLKQISKEERYARANIARMQAKVEGIANKKSKAGSLDKFYESRNKQLHYLMIVMLVSGICFLGYGVFKKTTPLDYSK